jgi:hypothetical protein
MIIILLAALLGIIWLGYTANKEWEEYEKSFETYIEVETDKLIQSGKLNIEKTDA